MEKTKFALPLRTFRCWGGGEVKREGRETCCLAEERCRDAHACACGWAYTCQDQRLASVPSVALHLSLTDRVPQGSTWILPMPRQADHQALRLLLPCLWHYLASNASCANISSFSTSAGGLNSGPQTLCSLSHPSSP